MTSHETGNYSGEKEGVRAKATFRRKLTPDALLTFLSCATVSWKVSDILRS